MTFKRVTRAVLQLLLFLDLLTACLIYPQSTSTFPSEMMVVVPFDFTYYTEAPDRNPPGPAQVMDHSLRGGSWVSPANQVQTFFRDSSHSVRPNPRVGFRCAADISRS